LPWAILLALPWWTDTTSLKVTEANSTSEITHHGHLVYYVVKKDDDLWKIAEKVYGKGYGIKNRLIFNANRSMLTSPNKIYPARFCVFRFYRYNYQRFRCIMPASERLHIHNP